MIEYEVDEGKPGMTPKVFSFVAYTAKNFLNFGKWTVSKNGNLKAYRTVWKSICILQKKIIFGIRKLDNGLVEGINYRVLKNLQRVKSPELFGM